MNNTDKRIVDLLDEDRPISGQKFSCISFISPENIIKQKNLFFFEQFLKQFDFNKSMSKCTDFINFISYKYKLNSEDLHSDFKEFVESEGEQLRNNSIEDDYKNFVELNEEKISNKFNEEHNFQTNVRGIKIRGSFPTQQEAELRAKMLRESDPTHDIFVGPVGVWMPWDPDAYKTGNVQYMNDELNELMSQKHANELKAKNFFDKRVKESKQEAIEENIKLATENGNKLTQTIDKDGNLIGVGDTTIEKVLSENETITSVDITQQLFEHSTKDVSSN
jgi:hypothetical protein